MSFNFYNLDKSLRKLIKNTFFKLNNNNNNNNKE